MKPIVLVVLFFIIHITSQKDYRLNLENSQTRLRHLAIENFSNTHLPTCNHLTELICYDQEVYLCAPLNGTFAPIYVQTCTKHELCLMGECKFRFPCTNVGIFPDPYDCKTFHVCHPESENLKLKSHAFCGGNYGFSPRTTYCDRKLVNGECNKTYPVPICEYFGQTGGLVENYSIYYVCLFLDDSELLYPYLFLCPNGGKYDGKFNCYR